MHAASVHPEPGSNSRNHGIKTWGLPHDPILLPSLALSFFYFCLSSILLKNFRVPLHISMLCTSLLLFNFQRSSRLEVPFSPQPRFRATLLLYHFRSGLSTPFSKLFSKSFKSFSRTCPSLFLRGSAPLLVDSLYIILLSSFFVKGFFWFFSFFVAFGELNSFYRSKCTTFYVKSRQNSQTICMFHQT